MGLKLSDVRKAAGESKLPTLKVHLVDREGTVHTNIAATNEDNLANRFTLAGAIDPPYSLTFLADLVKNSSALRPCIDAYATNIDGFGHRFEPIFDLDQPDIDQRLSDAMWADRMWLLESPVHRLDPGVIGLNPIPTPAEVAAKKEEIRTAMRVEKAKLGNFFDYINPDMSFVDLRLTMREDLEYLGNTSIEVLRNAMGTVVQWRPLSFYSVRLLPLDEQEVEVKHRVKASEFSWTEYSEWKRFRRFVQLVDVIPSTTTSTSKIAASATITTLGGKHGALSLVYFKEYGDPRIISKTTGKVYGTLQELQAADPNRDDKNPGKRDRPATELIHFKLPNPTGPYGVPRWIGALLAVLGNRFAEEVNLVYFDNNAMPACAIIASGTTLTGDSIKKIEDFFKENFKGRENFGRAVVLQGMISEVPGTPNRSKIEIHPLTDSILKEGIFLQYDERNSDKVGQQFRIPRLLRGDVRDFNRSTADASMAYAEQQVFGPERNRFDFWVNRRLLPELGIKYHAFVSNTPITKDPQLLGESIRGDVKESIITPNEARELLKDVYNKPFPKVPWGALPTALLKPAPAPAPGGPSTAGAPGSAAVSPGPSLPGPSPDPPPTSPSGNAHPTGAGITNMELTPSAIAAVITVNEARAMMGLSPVPRGELTIAEFQASSIHPEPPGTAPHLPP